MKREEALKYWIDGSEESKNAAQGMFDLGYYHWCLFFWQLSLEKLLKGLLVSQGKEIPYTHDLKRLAKEADLGVTNKTEERLNEITTFNLDTRYDDYKLSFYKKATKEYAEKWVKVSIDLYTWVEGSL